MKKIVAILAQLEKSPSHELEILKAKEHLDCSAAHLLAQYDGPALATTLETIPQHALDVLKITDDWTLSVAEVLAQYNGPALATILETIPQQALEILSLPNSSGNPVAHVLAEHHWTALATILKKTPTHVIAILNLPTNETLAVSRADLLMKLHNTPEMSAEIKTEIIKKIRELPKTPFAIFKSGLFGSSFSLGTFPTQGKPCFRHSSDISEENKPKRETAIQAEFITSVQKQAALIKTGAEQAISQLPAHAYTDPVVGRRLLKGLVSGTISKAFTIGTNILTLDVAFQTEIADKLRTDELKARPERRTDFLKALAENLSAFTDKDAQKRVAEAIFDGKFGNSPAVLTALAKNLSVFTDKDAQVVLAKAISDNKFCNDTDVLTALAKNLSVFTDKDALEAISGAIARRLFGATPAVLTALVENLHVFAIKNNVTSRHAVAEAILAGCLGDPKEVLATLHVLAINNKAFNPILTMLEEHFARLKTTFPPTNDLPAVLDGVFSV